MGEQGSTQLTFVRPNLERMTRIREVALDVRFENEASRRGMMEQCGEGRDDVGDHKIYSSNPTMPALYSNYSWHSRSSS